VGGDCRLLKAALLVWPMIFCRRVGEEEKRMKRGSKDRQRGGNCRPETQILHYVRDKKPWKGVERREEKGRTKKKKETRYIT